MTDYYSNKLKIITESLVNLDHVKDDILFPSDILQISDQLTKKLKSFWPTIITKHGYKISILIFFNNFTNNYPFFYFLHMSKLTVNYA